MYKLKNTILALGASAYLYGTAESIQMLYKNEHLSDTPNKMTQAETQSGIKNCVISYVGLAGIVAGLYRKKKVNPTQPVCPE